MLAQASSLDSLWHLPWEISGGDDSLAQMLYLPHLIFNIFLRKSTLGAGVSLADAASS